MSIITPVPDEYKRDLLRNVRVLLCDGMTGVLENTPSQRYSIGIFIITGAKLMMCMIIG
jgi:hypothetical protein